MSLKSFLCEPKTTIGWVHGILSIGGAFLLSVLSAMALSSVVSGDFAWRIVPSMWLTPLLACGYGFWLLFSKTLLHVIQKIALVCLLSIGVLLLF